MGVLFEEGLTVDKNIRIAFKYYKTAAKNGHGKAHTKLGHFYYSGVKDTTFSNTAETVSSVEYLSTAMNSDYPLSENPQS
mmetsp:Transcript_37745/g.27452  ORF Transcript_37745/g.27452 Transcript_37745/m.27452 type:complete len:80 (+) Transcript_37745:419-658(+)